ncbi:MAG: hypothetical protein IKH26_08735 [Bacteroidaceae bacterium]|nr:hypothetical protein [Bacteroidaceae bacterium]
MKKRLTLILSCVLSMVLLSSCDDGDIYDKEVVYDVSGRTAKLTGHLVGLSHWPTSHYIALAGFVKDNDYAVISKIVPSTSEDVDLVLSNIPDSVESVELCVLSRLRKRIYTLVSKSGDAIATTDTIRLESEGDVSMFNIIQQHTFNTTCVNCHGGSNFAGAGLYLTEGKSYSSMVGHPSSKLPEFNIVESGDAANSVLHKVLRTDLSKSWRYDHTSEIVSYDVLNLIDSWISNGAYEN